MRKSLKVSIREAKVLKIIGSRGGAAMALDRMM